MAQEILDSLVDEAIEDLQKSGLDNEEIFFIIKKQFGRRYAHRFYEKACYEKDSHCF